MSVTRLIGFGYLTDVPGAVTLPQAVAGYSPHGGSGRGECRFGGRGLADGNGAGVIGGYTRRPLRTSGCGCGNWYYSDGRLGGAGYGIMLGVRCHKGAGWGYETVELRQRLWPV